MATNVNYEQLAKAAGEGVARALSAQGKGGSATGKAQEHAIPRIICGGDLGGELYAITFVEANGQVTVGQVTKTTLT